MTENVVALFSGAGGLSLGFSRVGLKPVFAADVDVSTCRTYTQNLGVLAHRLDLSTTEPAQIGRLLPTRDACFAVIGGPPCQGFSTAGSRRAHDPRNQLVFHYLNLVDFLQPRWFLFENVEGLLTSNNGESIRDLIACFIERGYTVRMEKLNFAAYGLPQSRKRVVIVGNRMGIRFSLPTPSHSYSAGKHKSIGLLPPCPSLLDAIDDLPACGAEDGLIAYHREARNEYQVQVRENNDRGAVRHHFASPSTAEVERFRFLGPGQTMKHLPEEYWHPSYRRRAYRRVMDGTATERRGGAPSAIKRLLGGEAAPTITSAATREFVHPALDRPLTPREAARLQSFPDWFDFEGGPSSISLQIGNAVPPLAAEHLARHIVVADGRAGAGMVNEVGPGLLGFRLTDASGKSPALARTETLLRMLITSSGRKAHGAEAHMESLYAPRG